MCSGNCLDQIKKVTYSKINVLALLFFFGSLIASCLVLDQFSYNF